MLKIKLNSNKLYFFLHGANIEAFPRILFF